MIDKANAHRLLYK